MSRRSKTPKGILGLPKKAERQVFVFGRFAEELPSDDSDDADFTILEGGDKQKRQKNAKTRKCGKKAKSKTVSSNKDGEGEKSKEKNRIVQNDYRKTASKKKAKLVSSTDNKDIHATTEELNQTMNNTSVSTCISSGWTELIPTEILISIFQNVIKSISGSSVPFLCKMSRVCRRWREVAIEPVLWRKVDLSSSCVIKASSGTIERLAPSRLTAVTELSLLGWEKLTDKGMQTIGKHCKQLQSIVLAQCWSLTSAGVASLADNCGQLKMIDVAFTKIDITGLQHIVKVLGCQLENLSLRNCNRVQGESILPLIQEHCPNLTSLDLSSTNIRKLCVEKLQAGCPKLKHLFLVNLLLTSTPVCKTLINGKKPNGFPELETLGLPCGFIGYDQRNDRFLDRILWASRNLKMLDIRGPNTYSHDGLRRLPASSLEQLYFTNSASFCKVAVIVEKWHHSLEVLDLSQNKTVEDEDMELLKNFGMPKLHTLDLNNTNITALGLKSVLNGCPNLTDLNLSSCRGLPRGVKQRHQGEAVLKLPQRLVDSMQLSSDSE